jgi:hypothetical protein
MDVDKKIGMSLDDLIKKTRKDGPRNKGRKTTNPTGSRFEKKNKLGYVILKVNLLKTFIG